MTFKQAVSKMEKIANGEYHSVRYELTTLVVGGKVQECYLYLNPSILVRAGTWAEAFAMLEDRLSPKSGVIEDVGTVHELVEEVQG